MLEDKVSAYVSLHLVQQQTSNTDLRLFVLLFISVPKIGLLLIFLYFIFYQYQYYYRIKRVRKIFVVFCFWKLITFLERFAFLSVKVALFGQK